ncbi:TlpA family protein disulfide reductase [Dyadobacter crusticola]|uniref:TlpA family protein disulfide reductase n=1 Tax=Dyadobacter crusticola TaxID=292407 RepID=UPI00068B8278|nr:TlpA disulfide reductase family protein [Dyadobacter crusticola]
MAHQVFKLAILLLFATSSSATAQVAKPRVYIDSIGRRFTKAQFDSISAANRGKPIALNDRIENDQEVQFTFEVLTVNPLEAFSNKWVGQPFPEFKVKDINGRLYQNGSLNGKVVVFNFWSTTCAPCIEEMPRLNELVNSYTKQPVVFLAPSPEHAEKIVKSLAKHPFNYNILPDASPLFTSLGIDGYPYHIIVDKTGIIRAIYRGSRTDLVTKQPILNEGIVNSIEGILKK